MEIAQRHSTNTSARERLVSLSAERVLYLAEDVNMLFRIRMVCCAVGVFRNNYKVDPATHNRINYRWMLTSLPFVYIEGVVVGWLVPKCVGVFSGPNMLCHHIHDLHLFTYS